MNQSFYLSFRTTSSCKEDSKNLSEQQEGERLMQLLTPTQHVSIFTARMVFRQLLMKLCMT